MKHFFVIIAFISSLYANSLYKDALEYEKNGDFKNAMILYKQIAEQSIEKDIVKAEQNIVEAKPTLAQQQMSFIKNKINKPEDKETRSILEQIIKSEFDIYPYKENFFLPISYDMHKKANRKQNEAKFQLSIKKPISYDIFGLNETINFGYTQTSWWQIYNDSAPFRETNYKPEVFMMIPYQSLEKTSLKAYKVSFMHESNGQGSVNSRSWNRVYLEGYFQLSNLFLVPRVWYRIPEGDNDDNPDIHEYLGYGDLTLLFPYKNHTFKLLVRNNLEFSDENKGYAELNWTFPFFNSKNTFGYVQMSTGYGDSLIDYDQEINRFSIGISLSR